MDDSVRLSQQSLKVLKFLVENPAEERSGAEMSKCTGTASGTLYPMLARLEGAGWLSSRWEEIVPSKEGRPRRRLYKLTGLGQRNAGRALSDLQLGGLAWAT
jgi:PadR family transcriptional regulator, regulatory protein PadR